MEEIAERELACDKHLAECHGERVASYQRARDEAYEQAAEIADRVARDRRVAREFGRLPGRRMTEAELDIFREGEKTAEEVAAAIRALKGPA